MRLIAFSDSHGLHARVEDLIKKTKDTTDIYLFAGDVLKDVRNIPEMFPDVKLVTVPGNCDYTCYDTPIQVVEAAEKKIILTHGHLHHVKYGLESLQELAYQNRADVVVYGHTHCRAVDYINGIYYVNPGSLALPKDGLPPSYATIDIFPNEKGILVATVDY
ncbi:MAG: YfcE family phosphodiesterase [Oscillospiraceae bacterium]|nr:YfcE family phosphodiesterase [Oscillospiraceae bacterium]